MDCSGLLFQKTKYIPMVDIAKEIAEKLLNINLNVTIKRKGNTVYFLFNDVNSNDSLITYKVEWSMLPHIEAIRNELQSEKIRKFRKHKAYNIIS